MDQSNKTVVFAAIEYDGQPQDAESWVRDSLSNHEGVGNVFLSSGQTEQPMDLEQQLIKYAQSQFERGNLAQQRN